MRFINDYKKDSFHACVRSRICAKHSTGLTKPKNPGAGAGDALHTPILQKGETRLEETQGHSLSVREPGYKARQSDP